MEIALTTEQKQVDHMIEVRISRISRAAYEKANRLPSGRLRKKHKQYTLPVEVDFLLQLRQKLYNGENPESIAAAVTTNGDIQHAFYKAKQ